MAKSGKLTKEVKTLILDQGGDLVGVGSIDRFDNTPEETNPRHYMPTAQAVISVGIRVADGVCDVWGDYTQPGKSVSPYLFYGYGLINMELGRIVNLVAKRLEAKGHKALIFPPTWLISFYRFFERSFTTGDIRADFSHRHAAVAAGLGELGWHSLCMTPEFGTRVRFNSIITDAPLTPDPLYEGPKLCQPDECKFKCVEVCPSKAIPRKGAQACVVGEKTLRYAKIDKIRCLYGIEGLVKGSGGRSDVEIPEGPGNIEHFLKAREEHNLFDKLMLDNCFGVICGDFCGKCMHQCPAHTYERSPAQSH
jgi:epoxyqueuosine reductase QueG